MRLTELEQQYAGLSFAGWDGILEADALLVKTIATHESAIVRAWARGERDRIKWDVWQAQKALIKAERGRFAVAQAWASIRFRNGATDRPLVGAGMVG